MNELKSAHAGFFREVIRLLTAQKYLLVSKVAGLEGNEKIAELHKNFDSTVAPDYKDGYEYVSAQLFVALISSFEVFLQRVVAIAVTKNPKKLGSIQFRLSEILDASDRDELIGKAIDEHLNKLMYRKPMEYLDDICSLLSIDRMNLEDLWPIYAEAKARRDLGVHAAWKCNATYLRKVSEAGLTSALKIGESTVPDDKEYIMPVAETLQKLANRITQSVVEKHGN